LSVKPGKVSRTKQEKRDLEELDWLLHCRDMGGTVKLTQYCAYFCFLNVDLNL